MMFTNKQFYWNFIGKCKKQSAALQNQPIWRLNIVKGNVLRFDELHQYLAAHEYPFEIHVFEDGSRITSEVKFCPDTNTLIGLDSPFDPLTGLTVPVILIIRSQNMKRCPMFKCCLHSQIFLLQRRFFLEHISQTTHSQQSTSWTV